MNNVRYFHNHGLATREGNEWVTCEGYTGEPYTLPMRVEIPQGKENRTSLDEIAGTSITIPIVLKKGKKLPLIENVIDMHNRGKSLNYIGNHYGQHPSTIKKMLEDAGLIEKHDRIKRGASV